MKRKLTCTTPNGIVTRTTARNYTHVVTLLLAAGGVKGLSWNGSLQLAENMKRYWQRVYSAEVGTVHIGTVDGQGEVERFFRKGAL